MIDPIVRTNTVSASLIIPAFNAVGKIGRCIASLRQIALPAEQYEVIFVDDCSTDGTYKFLLDLCATAPNWRAIQLAANSGSPSEPRNRGMDAARGEFVFFLDCDDEILPDTLGVHLEHARRTGADIVRGHLIAESSSGRRVMNRIRDWSDRLSRKQRIEAIISSQSTIPCSLIRRELLVSRGLRWRSDIRMGEDTLFLVSVLAEAGRIEYVDHPTYIYVKTRSFTPSSTQSYGERELGDHLAVWTGAIAALMPLRVDYVTLRLQVGLQTALNAMIFFNRGDITPATFARFSAFLVAHRARITAFALSRRLKDILAIAMEGDAGAFHRACRPRLVIAGYDLKFITPIVPRLEAFYDIRIDEWTGHARHDEGKSRAALDWAELIWCEWLLENAVWYARNKRPNQVLVARMHRFELEREHGDRLNVDNVDVVVAVSTLFTERLLERFPNIPRRKARLQHNYVDMSGYTQMSGDERVFRLAMIGMLPARKGFHRALDILAALRRVDARYTLDVFGREPMELDWIRRHPEEVAYFSRCMQRIAAEGLSDAVRFRGHVDIKAELAAHGTGIVLSVSDADPGLPGPESFHLAVADAFAAGGVGLVRYWEGAEFIWPERIILPTTEAIASRILSYRNDISAYHADAAAGTPWVTERYGVENFIKSFQELFREAA